MDKETVLRQFDDLEAKIERLIETCKRLEAEKLELADKNRELEQQLLEKAELQQRHEDLKILIRSKIDGLMDRLSDFSEKE